MQLDMVGIIVSDMEAAQEFYQRLGFTVAPEAGADYAELVNQGVRLSLNTKKMIESIYGVVPTSTGDKIELAFLCQTATEVDEIVSRMASFGYTIAKEPWDAAWGQRYGIIEDVDGNLLSLFANLECEDT